MKNLSYIYKVVLLVFVFGLSSCEDWFDLRPKSETILEDYWKNASDVESMVASCYRAMNDGGFVDRLLVWGEVRSDNVIAGPGVNQSQGVSRILNLALNASNEYTSWFEFYRVINYCNTVIYYAETVREKDPNFTEGQLRAYLGEVKGIRALCYFTLVRAFRDIPYITEPVIDDSQSFEEAQTDPDFIIRDLIKDLIDAESSTSMEFDNYEFDKGRITRKAIWALIADMSLWIGDYQTCSDYCDKILSVQGASLSLDRSSEFARNLFLERNTSSEVIFSLLFTDFSNGPVESMYLEKLSSFDFSKVEPKLFGSDDLRGKDFYSPNETDGLFPIIKYVGYRVGQATSSYSYVRGVACYKWIFYRLADVYLMKAEALVERNSLGDLEAAFDLVSTIYDRANPELGAGSLNFDSYGSQGAMRNLVLEERQREFLFEGKRYFDLLRWIKREGSTTNIVNRYLKPKYSSLNQGTVLGKIDDKDALYMPINENELKVNLLLKQNPFYVVSSDINKN